MFVTLFNLQGAHRSSRRVFIIALGFSFVKSFFKFFQTFLSSFIRRSSGAIACRSHKRPAHFTTALFACQELFSSFSKLFEVLSAETLPCCAPLLRAAQLGYHTRFRLSSTFFELFQTLLCRPVSVGPLVGALAYTTRTFLLCQHLFSNFSFFLRPHQADTHLPKSRLRKDTFCATLYYILYNKYRSGCHAH